MKLRRYLPLFVSLLALAGCSSTGPTPISSASVPTSESTIPSSSSQISTSALPSGDGWHQQSSLDASLYFFELGHFNSNPIVDSIGDVPVLVLPIEFTNYPFTQSRLDDIRTAIEGSSEDTHYWESLDSFYTESSFGRLDLSFTFAEPYAVSTDPYSWFEVHKNETAYVDEGEAVPYYKAVATMPQLAMEGALNAYKDRTGDDCKSFDSDHDGFVDAIIMIYSCPLKKEGELSELLWAYQYNEQRNVEADLTSPIGFRYFWSSYSAFYEGVKEGQGVDAHTIIHEFGHLLGADDYYNYGKTQLDVAEPSGKSIMMAYNVCDHDIFTKLSYGWVDPYVVDGNCTLTISPSQESGQCILLADHWNGTCFDEFVIFELYTPTGLNELDAKTAYQSYKGMDDYGVRVYHIDHRLARGKSFDEDSLMKVDKILTDEEIEDWPTTARSYAQKYYVLPMVTNTYSKDLDVIRGKGFELIQFVQRGGTNVTKNGGNVTEADLFQTGGEFSLASHSEFFPAGEGKLNNGESLPFKVHFDEVTSEKATLTFTKTA